MKFESAPDGWETTADETTIRNVAQALQHEIRVLEYEAFATFTAPMTPPTRKTFKKIR